MLRRPLMLLLLSTLALAAAQPVQVLAPPDRFVAPGEYVTLVFRLTADAPVEVRLEASTEAGSPILSRLGDVTLAADRSTPIALTVEVPRDAPAFVAERVTLTVEADGVATTHSVELSVGERLALALEAPRDVTLSDEGVLVTVRNDGNGHERAVLELRRGSEVLERRELELAAGERRSVQLPLRDDGSHTLLLVGERSGEVRRALGVVRFGAPPPAPLLLAGEASASLRSSGAWQGAVTLRGPLSDLATLDARLDASTPRRSFAEVTAAHARVRVGAAWRDPLGLNLPSAPGVAATYRIDGIIIAGSLGVDDAGDVATGVGAEWRGDGVRVAAGAGWGDAAPVLALRSASDASDTRWSVAASYRREVLSATIGGEFRDGASTTRLAVEALDLLGPAARLTASVQLRDADGVAYADARVPLAAQDTWNGRLGVTRSVMSALPGDLRLAGQLGTRESFARVSYQSALGGGWRTSAAFGVRVDTTGLGLTLDSGWSNLGADAFAADLRVLYYPARGELDGRVSGRYQLERDAWTLSLGAAWDVGESRVGGTAAAGWRDGPWRVDVGATAGYDADATIPWSATVSLATRYAFDVAVPDALVEFAGGRDLGTIEGSVRADGEPLEGVELSVGRYRVRTDVDGAFTLTVPPGRYEVAVDLATLPVAFQLVDGGRTSLEVVRRETTEVAVAVVRTTVLRGRVLEDRSGDGLPDDPPVGVSARLIVTDAQGLRRSVVSAEDGSFELRGLPPGEMTAALVEVPAGASVVGEDARTLRLEPGVPGEAAFLVRPAVLTVRTFASQALRIRAITPEVGRAPPGSAPLVRVELQGEADAVLLRGDDGVEVALAPRDGAWVGRVPVASSRAAGVLGLRVTARAGEVEVSRDAQLVVDPDASALEVASDAPVRAGGSLTVRVEVYLEARAVTLHHPFGDDVVAVEDEPGRWSGVVAVPTNAADEVHELEVRVEPADGAPALTQTLRFRVRQP